MAWIDNMREKVKRDKLAREYMTPEQRLANYPPSMFDVPVDQQLVRYGN